MAENRYSQEEVDAILGRAIEREHGRGDLTHSDLVSAAREVGISADALEGAATEVLAERRRKGELVQLRQEQWLRFLRHLVPYLVVNGMLVTLNFLTSHFPWSLFPVFGWGIGLVFHFLAVAAPNPQRLERRLERQRDRQQRRERHRRIRENAGQLEQGLEQGISALLQAAAERIAGDSANNRARGQNRMPVVGTPSAPSDRSADSTDAFREKAGSARKRGGSRPD